MIIVKIEFKVRHFKCRNKKYFTFKDYDDVNGEFRAIIEPLNMIRNNINYKAFYVKKVVGGFLVQGEGYIYNKDVSNYKHYKKHIHDLNRELENEDIYFVECNNDGDIMNTYNWKGCRINEL